MCIRDSEERVRQATLVGGAQRLPGFSGVPGAPPPCVSIRREPALRAEEREHVDGVGVTGVYHDREAEVGGQPVRDGLPGLALVVGTVDTAVVLGEEAFGTW